MSKERFNPNKMPGTAEESRTLHPDTNSYSSNPGAFTFIGIGATPNVPSVNTLIYLEAEPLDLARVEILDQIDHTKTIVEAFRNIEDVLDSFRAETFQIDQFYKEIIKCEDYQKMSPSQKSASLEELRGIGIEAHELHMTQELMPVATYKQVQMRLELGATLVSTKNFISDIQKNSSLDSISFNEGKELIKEFREVSLPTRKLLFDSLGIKKPEITNAPLPESNPTNIPARGQTIQRIPLEKF